MSANGVLLQALLERDKVMDEWADEEYLAMLAILEAAHTEALGHISRLYESGDIAEITTQITAAYLMAVESIKTRLHSALPARAEEEGTFIRTLLKDATKLPVKTALIPWDDIAARPIAGSTLDQLAEALGVNNATDVIAETQRALEQGESLDELVRTLRGSVVKKAKWVQGKYVPGEYTGGVMTTDTRQTEMFARTAIMHVGNQAREAFYGANEDIIKGYMRVETMDDRICLACIVDDSHVYDVNAPRPYLPSHLGCRGIYVPVLKSYRELGIDRDELPAGVRASMNGAVPQYTTWRDVLEKADAKKLDEILGPTRAALYRGGMKVDDMVKDGNILTIKELKK